MGRLTSAEIEQVRTSLEEKGLTYAQLQDELLDHLICDIEKQMEQGYTFQQAWQQVMHAIPDHQLKNIQTETMEIINNKNGVTDYLSMLSFIILMMATTFKMLHWPGANLLIVTGLLFLIITTLIGVTKGFRFSPVKMKKGNLIIPVIGFFLIVFIISIFFQILHWPGMEAIRSFSTIGILILFSGLSVYFFQTKQSAEDNAILFLLDQSKGRLVRMLNSAIILCFLFQAVVLFRNGEDSFVSIIFPVLTLIPAGLFLFSLTWKAYTHPASKTKSSTHTSLLIFSIAALVLFMLPAMPWFFPENVISIINWSCYSLATALVLIYYLFYAEEEQNILIGILSFLLLMLPLAHLGIATGVINAEVAGITTANLYNVWVFAALILLFIALYKKPVFRTFMYLFLANYMLTYSYLIIESQ